MQCLYIGVIVDEFSLPILCILPHVSMKASQKREKEEPDQFHFGFFAYGIKVVFFYFLFVLFQILVAIPVERLQFGHCI